MKKVLFDQEILERISRHCPEALTVYIQCLNRSNDNEVVLTPEIIDCQMSESACFVKNCLKKLAKENILNWVYEKGIFYVSLANEE